MGVFGSLGNALGTIGRYYTTPEGLQTLGAGLKDISAGGSENMTDLRKMQMLQQQQAEQVRARAQQAAIGQKLAGLFGGQAAQSQPASVADMVSGTMNGQGGPSLEQVTQPLARPSTRDFTAALAQAAAMGYNIDDFVKLAQMDQPDIAIGPDGRPYSKKDPAVLSQRFASPTVVNGMVIDQNDPANLERYVPQLGEGMTYTTDASGRKVGVGNAPGYVDALGQATEAKQLGQTRGTMLNVPVSSGGTAMMTGGQYLGGAQGGQSAGGGRFGMTQTPQDAIYGTNLATAAAEHYKGLQTLGQQAPQKISRLKQIDALLGNYEGGRFGPNGVEIASALNSLGWKMDKRMSNAQAADAIGNQLVLDLNGGSLGTGFSNADRSFLEKTVPGLRQSSAGRKQLVGIGIATYQRQADIANKARQWQSRFGRIDAPDATGKTFEDYLQAWSDANPVFTP